MKILIFFQKVIFYKSDTHDTYATLFYNKFIFFCILYLVIFKINLIYNLLHKTWNLHIVSYQIQLKTLINSTVDKLPTHREFLAKLKVN